MTENEFSNLEHGEKIKGSDGIIYMVHNNYTSGEGFVVAVRTKVIPYRHSGDWKRIGKLKTVLIPGIYQITIDKKIN